MAAIITKDGMWRVSYGEDPNLSMEEVLKNQPAKYERMLPGNPKPGDYKLTNVGPYRIHQRCAESFRVGRITLAADAAHLVNPFGGMGLTGGIVDVGGLAECLIGIYKGVADNDILDKYSEKRMEKWRDYINPISSDNFLRVSATDPENPFETDKFLAFCKQMEEDETGKMKKDFDMVSLKLPELLSFS
jgi:2-polyprenyl-6-methoxyphenol hydroxylase-like FAD-dependent oxidoreductase